MSAAEPIDGPGVAGWLAIGAGLVSFFVLWPELAPVWALAVAAVLWGRRQAALPYPALLAATVAAALPGLYLYLTQRDAIGGFGSFLALASCVVLANARTRAEHKVTYLLSFILLMACGHRTLEIFYLAPVVGFFYFYAANRAGENHPGVVPRTRVAAGLTAASCALAVPIFLVMPRTRMSVMALSARGSLSGFGGEISFGSMGPMQLSDRLVMRVSTPKAGMMRGASLDRYQRSGWKNTSAGTRGTAGRDDAVLEVDTDWAGPGLAVDSAPEALDAAGRPRVRPDAGVVVQEVILEPFDQPQLFGQSRLVAVWARGQALGATIPGDVVRTQHDVRNEKLIYTAYSRPAGPDPAALAAVTPFTRAGRFHERYQQLPEDLPARVRDRARELTADAPTVLEKARQIERFLKTQFTYSLERDTQPGADPVDDLLFGDRRGHCEYFATAMAVMLRTQGVYTRCVVGFAEGEYNRFSESWTIRDRDAHAWTEVYFGRQLGWVEFDPTPPDPSHSDEAGGRSDLMQWLTAGLDGVDAWWQNEVVNYYYNEGGAGTESWMMRLDDFLLNSMGLARALRNPSEFARQAGRALATGAFVLAALAVAWRLGGIRLARPAGGLFAWGWAALAALFARLFGGTAGGSAGPPRGESAALRARLDAHLTRRGLTPSPAWTLSELVAAVAARDPASLAATEAVARAYAAETYAARPDPRLIAAARAALADLGAGAG